MAHNLAQDENGEYLFSSFFKDAWHRLGHIFFEERTAQEALEAFPNRFGVQKRKLLWDNGQDSGLYGIAKVSAYDDNDILERFGSVSESYHLVTPEEFCLAWDTAGKSLDRKWPIETLGFLGKGEKMFLLSKLPDVEIAGEDHMQYIVGVNDMTGKGSQLLKITDIRVVCENTMNAALSDIESTFKVDHDTMVMEDTIGWISDVLQTAEEKAATIKEVMEIMAGKRLVEEDVETALKVIVKTSKEPRKTGSPLYDGKLIEQWESKNALAITRRNVISELYNGAMIGYESPAVRGTAYGLYAATVEACDHVFPTRGDDNASHVTGWRSQWKDAAFGHLLEISKN